eukprot:1160352-Pelagomonas_calceolata.AAC.4
MYIHQKPKLSTRSFSHRDPDGGQQAWVSLPPFEKIKTIICIQQAWSLCHHFRHPRPPRPSFAQSRHGPSATISDNQGHQDHHLRTARSALSPVAKAYQRFISQGHASVRLQKQSACADFKPTKKAASLYAEAVRHTIDTRKR